MTDKITSLINSQPWYKKLEVLQVIQGWTQEEAAAQYGTTQKQVWAWNKGLQIPQRNNRAAIAKAHGLSVTDIFPTDVLKPEERKRGA